MTSDPVDAKAHGGPTTLRGSALLADGSRPDSIKITKAMGLNGSLVIC